MGRRKKTHLLPRNANQIKGGGSKRKKGGKKTKQNLPCGWDGRKGEGVRERDLKGENNSEGMRGMKTREKFI